MTDDIASLKARARRGDAGALQALRDGGFFEGRARRRADYPASAGQRRLWVLDELEGGAAAHHVAQALTIDGRFDRAAFDGAVAALVDRHEALRTTFTAPGGEPRQVVHDSLAPGRRDLDLRAAADPEAAARAAFARAAAAPFDLRSGPLLRVLVADLATDRRAVLFVLHHIVCDGWSLGILVEELSQAYAALAAGRPPALPPVPRQYRDFAAWQNAVLDGAEGERLRRHWDVRLAAPLARAQLAADRMRRPGHRAAGAAVVSDWPADLTRDVRALARARGATLFAALAALAMALLHRHTGEADVCLGTASAGREHPDLRRTVGFFVNTLVLRQRVDGASGFGALLAAVRDGIAEALDHQGYPFDRLVAENGKGRPIAGAMINFEPEAGLPELDGAEVRPFAFGAPPARFDLTLDVAESADALRLTLVYDAALFDEVRVAAIAEHLRTLAAAAVAEPDRAIAELPMLTDAERRRLLVEVNDTDRDWGDGGRDLLALVGAQARERPRAPAIVGPAGELSYADLARAVRSGARALADRGIRPGARVGLLLERSPDLPVAMLAVMAAGAAFVPLDAAHPDDRLAFIAADAGLAAVVARPELEARAARLAPLTIDVGGWTGGEPAQVARPRPDDLAYVIYTSGSTGRPKGVMVAHRGLPNLARAAGELLALGPGKRVLQFASPSFDACVWEIFSALVAGATLCTVPSEALVPGPALLRSFASQRVAAATLPPTVLSGFGPEDAPTLDAVVSAGEALPAEVAARWAGRVRLVNAYGPTEATVCATAGLCSAGEDGPPAIGCAIPNVRVYLLDGRMQPVPAGVAGEMWVGGIGVSEGYLGQPELTAQRFGPDPFMPGGRLFRTGDLGRRRADGTIDFLGRADDQIKIRGVRIEPGEVEQAFMRLDGVRLCHVRPMRAPDGGDLLTAYAEGTGLDPDALRRGAARLLPAALVPSRIVVLDRMPLTASGKVDRAALPEPAAPRRAPAPPRTPLEGALAEASARALGLTAVGIDDNFFERGGHSLAAMRFAALAGEAAGVMVSLRDVFASPTVAELAAALAGRASRSGDEIPALPAGDDYPASPGQRRLYALSRLGAGPAYAMAAALVLTGPLDVPALRRAFRDLVARHAVLRTRFEDRPDGLRQRVGAVPQEVLSECDLSSGPDADARGEAVARLEAGRAFDLDAGPLFRAALIRTAPERAVLVTALHHGVGDGWSMDVLFDDLFAFYAAARGEGAPPAPLTLQYGDVAVWQERRSREGGLDAGRRYWTAQLADVPTLDLPTDRPRPTVQSFAGATLSRSIAPGAVRAFHAFLRAKGATPFAGVTALVGVLLARHARQDEVVVGTPVAGRERPELARQIGFYVDTLPLRLRVPPSLGFAAVLGGVAETVAAGLAQGEVPFDRMVGDLQLRRDAGRSPVFDVMVSLTPAGPRRRAAAGLAVESLPLPSGTSKVDLTFAFAETADGGLDVGIEYCTALFDATRVARLAEHLDVLMRAAVAEPLRPVGDLPLMPDAELRLVSSAFNDVSRAPPRHGSIPAAFAEAARRHRDRPALRRGGQVLTYAVLDARSDGLARSLADRGLAPDGLVAVVMRPGPEAVVALLAVLKAGGAYLPIDPDFPPARVGEIVADGGCRLAIGHAGAVEALRREHGLDVLDGDALHPGHPPACRATASSLAYATYTSGSSGRAKGILIEQRGVLRLVLDADYLALGPEDGVAATGALAFDASTFQVWGALLNGACLALPERDDVLDPARLAAFLRAGRVSVLFLTTAAFNAHVDAGAEAFAGLRALLVGGERCSPDHFTRARRLCPGLDLLHVYGPSENTTFSTWHRVGTEEGGDVPIGRPIAGSSVYVVDGRGHLAPVGVPGEIWTGGRGVARGYIDRPELDAESFVAASFTRAPGDAGPLYRSGDLGWWREDGALMFAGRLDAQVKIRGFRVEPGEVEQRLREHPAVRDAVVLPRDTGQGTRELAAFAAPEGEEDLRAWLAERLPAFMVPRQVMRLAALPLTRNGKVDAAALLAGTAPPAEGAEPPRSPAEAALATAWREVLGCRPVGRDDDYFDLGGDSIAAIQVVGRLRRDGWDVDVRSLFTHPSLAGLAPLLRPLAPAAEGDAPLVGDVPLTAVQSWFFRRHAGGLHHFNQSVLLHPRRPLDAGRLREAVDALWRHHDGLRATFREGAAGIAASVAAPGPCPDFRHIDLSGCDDAGAALRRSVDAVAAGFDLAAGPLFAAVLFDGVPGQRLLLAAHHLVVDGVSWRILIEDVAIALDDPSALARRTASVSAWARLQREAARSPALEAEAAGWAVALAEAPERGEADGRWGEARGAARRLSPGLTAALTGGAHAAFGTETPDLLLAALGRALARWDGQGRHAVTVEGHGREELTAALDLTRTVGWFTSLYPVVLDGAGEPARAVVASKDRLRRLPRRGAGLLPLLAFGEVPLPDRWPEISFNYLGRFGVGEGASEALFAFAAEDAGPAIGADVTRVHALDVAALVHGDAMDLSIHHDPARHGAERVDALLDLWAAELGAVAQACLGRTAPEKTPSDLTAWDRFDVDGYRAFLDRHGLAAGEIEDVAPTSPLQAGLLFQAEVDRDPETYFVQVAFTVEGDVTAERLGEAWGALARRHPALRVAFLDHAAGPLQAVLRSRAPGLSTEDRTSLSIREQRVRDEAARAADRARGFDLGRDPLIRAAVADLGGGRFRLVWSFHHLVVDGWSLGVLFREWAALLARRPLPPAPSFATHLRWLGDRPAGAAARHWRDALDGCAATAGLPRPLRASGDGPARGEVRLVLDASLTASLRALAASEGATLATALYTLWGLLLARHNGVDDVVFGAVVSGRSAEIPGIEDAVGLFINTVPTRVRALGDVRAVLRAVWRDWVAGEPHHHHPLAEILAASPLGRDTFDHVVTVENYPLDLDAPARAGLAVGDVAVHDQTHYPLAVVIAAGRDVSVALQFDARRLAWDAVERLGRHLEALARAAVAAPEAPVATLDMLGTEERRQLLDDFGRGGPRIETVDLVAVLDGWVRRAPAAPAVRFGEVELSYAELVRRAEGVAAWLASRPGVGRDARIGLCLDRSDWLPVAVWGVLKADAAFVPLDPSYPPERIRTMVEDAGCPVVLADARHFALLDGLGSVELADPRAIATGRGGADPRERDPGALAYVFYTSGTTGRPKGAMIERRNLAAYIAWAADHYLAEGQGGSCGLFTAFGFDLTVTSLFLPFFVGRTLHVLPQDLDAGAALEAVLRPESGIDIVKLTPSHVALLADLPLARTEARVAIVGGEALAPEAVAVLERLNPALMIVNEYGPTETTVGCVVKRVRSTDERILIGRPIAGASVVILDRYGAPVPADVPGEIYVGGAGVGRGYLGRPDLTAERFVPSPFRAGERLFRTGDLGLWRAGGDIDCLGRADDQVKVRGHRIEPAEVEAALMRHDAVGAAAVVAWRGAEGDRPPELVAYLVPPQAAGREAELRRHLRACLPEPMVPTRWIGLDAMPLTVHGKVDRRALPAPAASRGAARRAPRDAGEERVFAIWAAVLGRDDFGCDDGFFDVGGHSLKAMQAVARLRAEAGLVLSLRAFLDHPTVGGQARLLRRAGPAPRDVIPPAEPADSYPLSHAQRRIYLASRFGNGIAYHMPKAYLFERRIDAPALGAALRRLVARHEALRTGFEETAGELRQLVLPEAPFDLAGHDLSGLDPQAAEARARALADALAVEPFDLARPPLMRAAHIALPGERTLLVLVLHHIVGDGWSMTILYEEVAALYAAFRAGREPRLAPTSLQYKDYAAWQARQDFARERDHWRGAFAVPPEPVRLPARRTAAAESAFAGATARRTLPGSLRARLAARAATAATGLSDIVLALFLLSLGRLTGQDDLCIALSFANRSRLELERVVGFFVNLVPVRVRLDGAADVDGLLRAVTAATRSAADHQDLPFDLLVEMLNPRRRGNRAPLVNVVYAFQNFADLRLGAAETPADPSGPGSEILAWTDFPVTFATAKFDWTLFVADAGEAGLDLTLEYDAALFDGAAAERCLAAIARFADLFAPSANPAEVTP